MTLRHLMRLLGPGRKEGRNLTYQEAYDGFSAVLGGTESEITIGGVKRTPDDFLRLVRMGKDEATAVYFSNSEGMKHVIAITVEPKR